MFGVSHSLLSQCYASPAANIPLGNAEVGLGRGSRVWSEHHGGSFSMFNSPSPRSSYLLFYNTMTLWMNCLEPHTLGICQESSRTFLGLGAHRIHMHAHTQGAWPRYVSLALACPLTSTRVGTAVRGLQSGPCTWISNSPKKVTPSHSQRDRFVDTLSL